MVERAAELVEISQPVPITPVAFGRAAARTFALLDRVLDDRAHRDRRYLWLRLRARFHSPAWIEQSWRARNTCATRAAIERTIVELQGLFIKVGQLI